jgi:formylglycine-generating enzyme required for sulfatase activity
VSHDIDRRINMRGMLSKLAGAVAVATLAGAAQAQVSIDWVTVGDPGNSDNASFPFYGGVAYEFRIGTYEVTNDQYCTFLNAVDPTGANSLGLYNSNMGSNSRGGIDFDSMAANGSKYSTKTNFGNKPVNYVLLDDAARFANWLHNGRGSGDTENGAYDVSTFPGTVTRDASAKFYIPHIDEWYKAAYYDGGTTNYWAFPTQSNSAPTKATANSSGDVSNPGANVANYDLEADWNGDNGNVTTVGSAGSTSYYGTYDQGGNVTEMMQAHYSTNLVLAGGDWSNNAAAMSSGLAVFGTVGEFYHRGFRVARTKFCLADWNDSGGQPDSSDYLDYLNDYGNNDPRADLYPPGGDGVWNSSDIIEYLNLYNAGC